MVVDEEWCPTVRVSEEGIIEDMSYEVEELVEICLVMEDDSFDGC